MQTTLQDEVDRGKKLIEEGDGEANIAYYCLHELHLTPSAFLDLPRKERPSLLRPLIFGWSGKRRNRKKLNGNSAGAAESNCWPRPSAMERR